MTSRRDKELLVCGAVIGGLYVAAGAVVGVAVDGRSLRLNLPSIIALIVLWLFALGLSIYRGYNLIYRSR